MSQSVLAHIRFKNSYVVTMAVPQMLVEVIRGTTPLKNPLNPSLLKTSTAVPFHVIPLDVCILVLTTSRGFVILAVVQPVRMPARTWIPRISSGGLTRAWIDGWGVSLHASHCAQRMDWYAPYEDHQMAEDGTNVTMEAPSPLYNPQSPSRARIVLATWSPLSG